jgi:hypothetical protein
LVKSPKRSKSDLFWDPRKMVIFGHFRRFKNLVFLIKKLKNLMFCSDFVNFF